MNRPAERRRTVPHPREHCSAVRCGGVPLTGDTPTRTPARTLLRDGSACGQPSRTVPQNRPAKSIFPLHGPKDLVGDLSPWTDDLAWCARIGALPTVGKRRVVLREWVEAAGGWSDAAAVHLPSALPAGLALAWIRTHARALRLDVHEDLT